MTNEQLAAYLTLSFTPNLGGVGLSKLLAKDDARHLIQYSAQQLMHLGLKPQQIDYIKQANNKEVIDCLHWLEADNHYILTPQDNAYPELMLQISSHPPVLFVKGNIDALSLPQIAIVGSRNASMDGLRSAREFAENLTKQGLGITSGLALGVDGHAHDGALKAYQSFNSSSLTKNDLTDLGKTIAVLGSGLENIYPKKHQGLAMRILQNQGALVSELRPNTPPRAEFFPRRNRIISGLSLAVLIVEASERSGSLITARYALEQNRDVFAVPGSIYSSSHQGSNQLIQQGAMLVQSAQDIMMSLQWSFHSPDVQNANNGKNTTNAKNTKSYRRETRLNKEKKEDIQKELFAENSSQKQAIMRSKYPNLIKFLGNEPISVDILVERTHIAVQDIMNQLLELELNGEIMSVSGGYVRCN